LGKNRGSITMSNLLYNPGRDRTCVQKNVSAMIIKGSGLGRKAEPMTIIRNVACTWKRTVEQ